MSRRKTQKTNLLNGNLPSESYVLITFDQFFHGLLQEYKVQPHHKAPLREFFKSIGISEASKEEFLDLFKSY